MNDRLQFSDDEWAEFVAEGQELVEKESLIQFKLGDITLDRIPVGSGARGVEALLHRYADDIGSTFESLATYRYVANAWPKEQRVQGVSFTVHRLLTPLGDRFEVIKHPPEHPTTHRRYWSPDQVRRFRDQTPVVPATRDEKVNRARELLNAEEDAATIVNEMLRRPEVAGRVVADAGSRNIFDRTRTEQYRQRRDIAPPSRDQAPPPHPTSAPYQTTPMEILELISVFTNFSVQMHRLVPRLPGLTYGPDEEASIKDRAVQARACIDWCLTVVETGKTDMDEQLARLISGEPS
ncbi:DUF6192 family protein [Actinomadura rupiterrae]|uniref:DUF6192 family protein n=1 Tax=Actinomadura rupiterrae TaxID=559627 RepID=UPI0020A612BE|nr:DUF6192 family protein [Actinomadura rupiterrae]MCP2337338.1 hypothetical protein [Actinomadura rupiterrae]